MKKGAIILVVTLLIVCVLCFSACGTKNGGTNASDGKLSDKGKKILEGLIAQVESLSNRSEIEVLQINVTPVNFFSERVSVLIAIPETSVDGVTTIKRKLVKYNIEIENKMDSASYNAGIDVKRLNSELKSYFENKSGNQTANG